MARLRRLSHFERREQVGRQQVEIELAIACRLVDAAFGRDRDRHAIERDAREARAESAQVDLLAFAVGARDLHAGMRAMALRLLSGSLPTSSADRIGEIGGTLGLAAFSSVLRKPDDDFLRLLAGPRGVASG